MLKKLFLIPLAALAVAACSDDEDITTPAETANGEDINYVGQAVGNFSQAEWICRS